MMNMDENFPQSLENCQERFAFFNDEYGWLQQLSVPALAERRETSGIRILSSLLGHGKGSQPPWVKVEHMQLLKWFRFIRG